MMIKLTRILDNLCPKDDPKSYQNYEDFTFLPNEAAIMNRFGLGRLSVTIAQPKYVINNVLLMMILIIVIPNQPSTRNDLVYALSSNVCII
jgi:hypothetical protein